MDQAESIRELTKVESAAVHHRSRSRRYWKAGTHGERTAVAHCRYK
ncbi:hypothetical protein [Paenibacillus chungangensis]|uniref:Uncharacterized protein n=1 Tax=Paenibacillus chungangensis TaxID=696535 RepID=A0ABW3HUV9_9BACL